MRVVDKVVGSAGQTSRKLGPDKRAGRVEQELGQTIGGQLGNVAIVEGEDHRCQNRLDDIPQQTKDGLFVNRDEIGAYEEHDQVAVLLQLAHG